MKAMETKEKFMQKTIVVWLGALVCCLLWGSAFPCIKIGYQMMHIASDEVASQILYAGYRWTKQIGTNVEKMIRRNDSINYSPLYLPFVTLQIFILKRGS